MFGSREVSLGLCTLGRWCLQLSAKYPIPKPTGNAEPVLEISVVVLQVVLLELFVVQGETVHSMSDLFVQIVERPGATHLRWWRK